MRMIHSEFVLRYTRKSTGICGQSNRPMLNGGLSPLRFDRKTVESKTAADLRIKSTGLTATSFLNNYPGDRTTAILRSLPPKVCCMVLFHATYSKLN